MPPLSLLLLYLLAPPLAVVALIDCGRARPESVRHLPKPIWIAVIIGMLILGPIAWLLCGRRRRPRPAQAVVLGTAPRGPEDDPEFLRQLDEGMSDGRFDSLP
jgi:hypothetical protein